jgi:hypothetical protein
MIAGIGIISSRKASGNRAAAGSASPCEQHHAGEDPNHRHAAQEELGAENAGDQCREAADQQHQPHDDGWIARRRELLPPLPDQIGRDRNDEKTMRIVAVVNPVVDQFREHRAVEERERRHRQRNRGPQAESFHTILRFARLGRLAATALPIRAETCNYPWISGNRSKHATMGREPTEQAQ